jgi:hypothetical protein
MSWFPGWVEIYRTATGADQRTVAALLADEAIVLGTWKATPEELGEVTTRLIARCQVPSFAPDHIKALGRGLLALREERAAARKVEQQRVADCGCAACNGGVAVPEWEAARARLRASLVQGIGCSSPRRGR